MNTYRVGPLGEDAEAPATPAADLNAPPTAQNETLDRALTGHLTRPSRCDRPDSFRVEEVLKRGDAEVTEVVYLVGEHGDELGPFIRKRIAAASGIGGAYEAIYRAQREGTRFAHLPLIMRVNETEGEVRILMEFVPGETVGELVGHIGGSTHLARRVMPAICDAVTELHTALERPLVHRDLKPGNVIVHETRRSDGLAAPCQATLIDLGIARSWKAGAQADTTHLGTRRYAPPEQFGFGQTDERSDVYALGKLALFCCTGREPEVTTGLDELRAAGVPQDIARVILRACAFDPAARYPSARALKEALLGYSTDGAACEGGTDAVAGPFDEGTDHMIPAFDGGNGVRAPKALAVDSGNGDRASEMPAADSGNSDRTPEMPATTASDIEATPADADGALSPASEPTSPFRELADLCKGALARVPRWVGIAWNICLLSSFVLMVGISIDSIKHPTEKHLSHPAWFCTLEYVLIIIVPCAAVYWWMADHRRLLGRIPVLGSIPRFRGMLVLLVACSISLIIAMIIGKALGFA